MLDYRQKVFDPQKFHFSSMKEEQVSSHFMQILLLLLPRKNSGKRLSGSQKQIIGTSIAESGLELVFQNILQGTYLCSSLLEKKRKIVGKQSPK